MSDIPVDETYLMLADSGSGKGFKGLAKCYRDLRASNAALIAENEALRADLVSTVAREVGYRERLSLYTSWRPSDPGTKEAMEWARNEQNHWEEQRVHGQVLVTALTAAMVRLEEAEKELGVRRDAERAIIENHCGTECLACGSFWTNTGHGGKPWHKDGCQLAALTASLATVTKQGHTENCEVGCHNPSCAPVESKPKEGA